jgi:arylsulfatase A-like enzyme
VRADQPRYAFVALTGIDKTSHAMGHDSAESLEAMRIVDELVARLRADAERAGRWEATHLWVVSDHGHSAVREHDDLAALVASMGLRVLAHPRVLTRAPDVAVMVSGNAMAHLYVELERRERPYWGALAPRWRGLVDAIITRPSGDLAILATSATACEIRGRGRGTARLCTDGAGASIRYSYHPVTGDPLGIGELHALDEGEAYDATIGSDYPDALVQIARIVACARSGDVILSAAREWDLRGKYEPIPHRSTHGALHREHMLVPLLTNHPVRAMPRRTVDVMASACDVLGVRAPHVEGVSFA